MLDTTITCISYILQVVYVARNPKDMFASYLNHQRILEPHGFKGTDDEFVDYFVNDQCKRWLVCYWYTKVSKDSMQFIQNISRNMYLIFTNYEYLPIKWASFSSRYCKKLTFKLDRQSQLGEQWQRLNNLAVTAFNVDDSTRTNEFSSITQWFSEAK